MKEEQNKLLKNYYNETEYVLGTRFVKEVAN